MNRFLKSALAAVLIAILAVSSFAAGSLVTISVDPSIKILVNGKVFQPKDANGNDVMTFTYNGTTYAPLRAMAEAFGLEVGYDSAQRMATVGEYKASEAAPDPEPNTLYSGSGNGDSIVRSIKISEPSRFIFSTDSDDYVRVKAYYGEKDYEYDSLVSSSESSYGNYLLIGGREYDFEITCNGNWSYKIEPLSTTTATSFFGTGSSVTKWFSPEVKYYYVTYKGNGYFKLKQYYGLESYDYESIVSTSEPYFGTVRLSTKSDTCFFEIYCTEGSWLISPAE